MSTVASQGQLQRSEFCFLSPLYWQTERDMRKLSNNVNYCNFYWTEHQYVTNIVASYSFCLTFGSKTFFERLKRERCRLVGATWFGLVQSPFLTHISHLPVQLIRYYSERTCTESSDHIFSCVSKKKFVPSKNYNVLNSVWVTFLQH